MENFEAWYTNLNSQVLDLISDYAGQELFCLEGDSVVLECLDDPALDFQNGYQILHAVYKVERFLSRLLSTKCNFHIVFFDENRDIASSTAHKDLYRSKYSLAREIIVQHLKHVQEKHPEIKVNRFSSAYSTEFRNYVQMYNVYFVMCHNGALRERKEATFVEASLRVICNMMALGLDVAIMNEIEWSDSKVMTRVLQASSFRRSIVATEAEECEVESIAPSTISKCLQDLQSLAKLKDENPSLAITGRDALTLAIASSLVLETEDEDMDDSEASRMVIALFLQLACLKSLSLGERRIKVRDIPNPEVYDRFLDRFCQVAAAILQAPEWQSLDYCENNYLYDLVDGRVLRSCVASVSENGMAKISSKIGDNWGKLLELFQAISKYDLPKDLFEKHNGSSELDLRMSTLCVKNDAPRMTLLPFKHNVFDKHLESVHVDVESSDDDEPIVNVVQDNKHWHNSRPIIPRRSEADKKPHTKWKNPFRFNQILSRDMDKYAASLTNSKGHMFEREVIISKKPSQGISKEKKISGTAKAIVEKNKASQAKKEASFLESWKQTLRQTQNLDVRSQIKEIRSFLEKLKDRKREVLEPEVRVFILTSLVTQYQNPRIVAGENDRNSLAREIWDEIRILRQIVNGMTQEVFQTFQKLCQKMGLSDVPQASPTQRRPLSFPFDIKNVRPQQIGAPLDFQAFQLMHCGPFMDRQTGAKEDKRVAFKPDKWQRDVLDELDKNHSIFVVAPTSAGKTFISFYAMSKVLKEDDSGVLVYVAPTKALVNQIAAEINARFEKSYPKSAEQTVWAIHTRDTRMHNPMKCQILVTVPHILQIMLLSPVNARIWAPRVKCIIFDEIHSIGQADDGLVWEQLLLLAPCRIIALSATVGNPKEFEEWLSSTQRCLGNPLKLIQYGQRYSDLRKFLYYPPKEFKFQGLSRPQAKGILESESIEGLRAVHPIASLLNKRRQMPEDLSLEPRDCYLLWKCMLKYASSKFPVPEKLSPKNAMASFIRRSDVSEWEADVKEVLSKWMTDPQSPFESVRKELGSIFSPEHNKEGSSGEKGDQSLAASPASMRALKKEELSTSVFPLLVSLHKKNALPALLFNYERTTCEQIAETTLKQLRDAENEYKKGASWQRKMTEYRQYQSLLSRQARTADKNGNGKRKQNGDQGESYPDPAENEIHPLEGFDPERPLEEFSFAGTGILTREDLQEEIETLKYRNVKDFLCEALERGIGVHHAGMNRQYRQCVERLFRAGFLRVVVATGTLALGINMPCSTVIFCGDSVFLTALNFRQAAGRAGRRGFDVLGNVIFHGIPHHKAFQLISSRLPDLNGHFPITTSLVLRLFILLHNSQESEYAVRAINSLLSQPRLYFGSAESNEKEKVLHHLRFSIEYLRRQRLLGPHGEPIELACCISHLYYTENSAFSFHALLHSGYFERLCESTRSNTENRMKTLMVVLCHLFGRKSLGHRYKTDQKSPSIVVLPTIPAEAAAVIRAHNSDILKTYTTYVATYINQHMTESERELPLSGISVTDQGNPELSRLLGAMEANKTCSPFVGLSGHDDEFESIKDLCQTVRSGVFLEEGVIPHLDIYPDGGMAPLNAYLYDFFCHENLGALEDANHVSRSEAWFLLNDFSMVLATIIVALEGYINPDKEQDPLDIMAAGDEMSAESDSDDESDEAVNESNTGETEYFNTPKKPSTPAAKDEILDNWDDMSDASESSEDESSETSSQNDQKQGSTVSVEVLNAFRQLKDEFDEKFRAIFA
ncbi:hypothetical protein ASPWEDRAFT_112958 [Aspergillus wentii DTO 134E9]|uniref:DEAD/DEAH box helicase n=1 Tax=Aspergillus wentii DTO 134E9 TaxID=1073089 RepID=A0A1L9RH24_ASPWE|nr:uncharacterized protein ASPWEDRAFT_112958 [Aspergillus wentii DTO 134E9]OJJ34147.1 hypothetical protein ASPWEDRAFT_112958 [Aspergillus wentii DTO 134E9]